MAKTAFILAGTASNVGKTTVTTAILHAFTQEGLKVQAFKCGPDYLDPTFHSFVTGVPSINLDLHLMSQEALVETFTRHGQTADIVVIEGVMGLYDGWDHSFDNGSAAHIGRVLGVPVVLIVDGSGISTSVAAMVKGYQMLDPRMQIAGVIINKVSSKMHCDLLADAIKMHTGLPVLGYVPKQTGFSLESRHLGLKPASEVTELKEKLDALTQAIKGTLNFEALRNLKITLPSVPPLQISQEPVNGADHGSDEPPYRVAYALDEAFYFYYQDNLNLMRSCGMELVPFSPIHDKELPPGTEAIYLGGGYPELHCKALSENVAMRSQILGASHSGMPIYAECGGMMYLCDAMEGIATESDSDTAVSSPAVTNPLATYEMVGALKGKARMTDRLQRFGYVEIELKEPCLLGNPESDQSLKTFKGHEFHRSTVDWQPDQSLIYRVKKGYGSQAEWTCGAQNNNTLGAYAHIHFGNRPETLEAWIDIIKTRRKSNG